MPATSRADGTLKKTQARKEKRRRDRSYCKKRMMKWVESMIEDNGALL
jgi:hypothetical protein